MVMEFRERSLIRRYVSNSQNTVAVTGNPRLNRFTLFYVALYKYLRYQVSTVTYFLRAYVQ